MSNMDALQEDIMKEGNVLTSAIKEEIESFAVIASRVGTVSHDIYLTPPGTESYSYKTNLAEFAVASRFAMSQVNSSLEGVVARMITLIKQFETKMHNKVLFELDNALVRAHIKLQSEFPEPSGLLPQAMLSDTGPPARKRYRLESNERPQWMSASDTIIEAPESAGVVELMKTPGEMIYITAVNDLQTSLDFTCDDGDKELKEIVNKYAGNILIRAEVCPSFPSATIRKDVKIKGHLSLHGVMPLENLPE